MKELRRVLVIIVLLLYSNKNSCGDCNFNLSYRGLSCNLDLSHKNLNNIKKLLNNNNKFVALTFDDGPSNNKAGDILNVLEDYKTKATFFLLGERINKKTSEIVRKIYETGHELGNHSWSHRKLTLLTSEEQLQELEKTSIAIKNVTEQDVKWFRPPYGCHNDNVIENANRLSMYSVLWTVDSLDWQGGKPEILVERVVSNVHNGAVILFHDHNNRSNTVEALPKVIEVLKKLGYELITLSEWEERVCDVVETKSVSKEESA